LLGHDLAPPPPGVAGGARYQGGAANLEKARGLVRGQASLLQVIDRSYALRGNASTDAPRSALEGTRSVPGCIPTQSVGTIKFVTNKTRLVRVFVYVQVPSAVVAGLTPSRASLAPTIVSLIVPTRAWERSLPQTLVQSVSANA
jgi:hypothetical protein